MGDIKSSFSLSVSLHHCEVGVAMRIASKRKKKIDHFSTGMMAVWTEENGAKRANIIAKAMLSPNEN